MKQIYEIKIMLETIRSDMAKLEKSKNPLKEELMMVNAAKITALEWVLNGK